MNFFRYYRFENIRNSEKLEISKFLCKFCRHLLDRKSPFRLAVDIQLLTMPDESLVYMLISLPCRLILADLGASVVACLTTSVWCIRTRRRIQFDVIGSRICISKTAAKCVNILFCGQMEWTGGLRERNDKYSSTLLNRRLFVLPHSFQTCAKINWEGHSR